MASKRHSSSLATIGELGRNIDILRGLRDELFSEVKSRNSNEERWDTFKRISEEISEACSDRDLSSLASAVRDMKNKLKRPSVRRDLDVLRVAEGKEKKPVAGGKEDEGTSGDECKCAKCGEVLEGSRGECIEGSLCPKCALKKKKNDEGDKAKKVGKEPDKEPDKKADSPDDAEKSSSVEEDIERRAGSVVASLRRRGYL